MRKEDSRFKELERIRESLKNLSISLDEEVKAIGEVLDNLEED